MNQVEYYDTVRDAISCDVPTYRLNVCHSYVYSGADVARDLVFSVFSLRYQDCHAVVTVNWTMNDSLRLYVWCRPK